ncbi:MAG: dihydrodipicolinate synthase family protein, partial [Actinomycetales bacterium]
MPYHPSRSFGSVSVAMATPFTPDGALDVDAAVALATALVDDGCDALVLNGTTGESPTTHQPEKDELVREV